MSLGVFLKAPTEPPPIPMQVIKEVLCWTREPMEVRRIAEHKEAVLTEMLGDMQPMLVSHVSNFMDSLSRNKVSPEAAWPVGLLHLAS